MYGGCGDRLSLCVASFASMLAISFPVMRVWFLLCVHGFCAGSGIFGVYLLLEATCLGGGVVRMGVICDYV